MNKHRFNTNLIRTIGLISGLIGIGLILLAFFWKPAQFSNSSGLDETLQIFQTQVTNTQDSTTNSRIDLPIPDLTPDIQTAMTPSPTPQWMIYDGIDFREMKVDALFTLLCNKDVIYLEPFEIAPYNSEIMQNDAFSSDMDFAVAWEHLGYYGLWIHSGLSYNLGALPAYPLQINIERDPRGVFRTPRKVDQYLKDCVISAEMQIRQENSVSMNNIIAAVRVPPSEIDEVSQHTMDLVPYLAETYPDSGFEKMLSPGLILYFCGQKLGGEIPNPNYNDWTQARFIIGVMPVVDNQH